MRSRLHIAVLLVCVFTGCKSLPTEIDVAQKIVDAKAAQVPLHWQHAAPEQLQIGRAALNSVPWWQPWQDRELNALIELALANSRDIAKARAALVMSKALSLAQRASEKPQIQIGTRSSSNPEGTRTYFRIGLEAQWEALLFGARANQRQIAQVDVRTAELYSEATRFLVTTQVAEHLFHVRADHQRMALLVQQDQLASENLRLIGVRITQGLAIATDQQELMTQKQHVQSQLKKLALDIFSDEQAISLLIAGTPPPPRAQATEALPEVALTSILPMPIAVVRLRPDVALAEQAVYRAGATLGLARTELYPHLALAGAIGAFIGSNGAIHWQPELGPIIDIPLFDGGVRRAKVTAQEQALEIALLGYQQALQVALGEVELALNKEQMSEQSLRQAELQISAAEQILMQVEHASRQAQASLIDVNDATLALNNAKLARVDAEEEALLAQIALRLALGT